MKFVRIFGFIYLAVMTVNFLGCEAPHTHHTEVISERVVEQQEVVE